MNDMIFGSDCFVELTISEQEEISGGVVIATACALAGLFVASFAVGYTIGRDIWS